MAKPLYVTPLIVPLINTPIKCTDLFAVAEARVPSSAEACEAAHQLRARRCAAFDGSTRPPPPAPPAASREARAGREQDTGARPQPLSPRSWSRQKDENRKGSDDARVRVHQDAGACASRGHDIAQ